MGAIGNARREVSCGQAVRGPGHIPNPPQQRARKDESEQGRHEKRSESDHRQGGELVFEKALVVLRKHRLERHRRDPAYCPSLDHDGHADRMGVDARIADHTAHLRVQQAHARKCAGLVGSRLLERRITLRFLEKRQHQIHPLPGVGAQEVPAATNGIGLREAWNDLFQPRAALLVEIAQEAALHHEPHGNGLHHDHGSAGQQNEQEELCPDAEFHESERLADRTACMEASRPPSSRGLMAEA